MEVIINFIEQNLVTIIVSIVIFLLIMLLSLFRILEKAKIDGYKALIPIYNLYLLIKIADLPIFFVPLFFLPILNIFTLCYVSIRIAENFHKKTFFKIGICLFPILFYPVLAFSKSLYKPEAEEPIRPQDQDAIFYNQIPSVEEVVGATKSSGLIESNDSEPIILDIDVENDWEHGPESETERTKKVVIIDPLKDDPLFNPEAAPIKIASLDHYKVCKNCKARLDIDAKICFLCGHPVEEDE